MEVQFSPNHPVFTVTFTVTFPVTFTDTFTVTLTFTFTFIFTFIFTFTFLLGLKFSMTIYTLPDPETRYQMCKKSKKT